MIPIVAIPTLTLIITSLLTTPKYSLSLGKFIIRTQNHINRFVGNWYKYNDWADRSHQFLSCFNTTTKSSKMKVNRISRFILHRCSNQMSNSCRIEICNFQLLVLPCRRSLRRRRCQRCLQQARLLRTEIQGTGIQSTGILRTRLQGPRVLGPSLLRTSIHQGIRICELHEQQSEDLN